MFSSTLRIPLIALLASACFTLSAQAEGPRKPNPPPVKGGGPTACAEVKGSVRMEAYGYTHLVTLRNGCDKTVVCEVWTDVDPTPRYTLRAKPGDTDETITRRGSPAREVTAQSSCHFE